MYLDDSPGAVLDGHGEAEHDPGGRGVAAVAKHAHGGPYSGGGTLKQLKCRFQMLMKYFEKYLMFVSSIYLFLLIEKYFKLL